MGDGGGSYTHGYDKGGYGCTAKYDHFIYGDEVRPYFDWDVVEECENTSEAGNNKGFLRVIQGMRKMTLDLNGGSWPDGYIVEDEVEMPVGAKIPLVTAVRPGYKFRWVVSFWRGK